MGASVCFELDKNCLPSRVAFTPSSIKNLASNPAGDARSLLQIVVADAVDTHTLRLQFNGPGGRAARGRVKNAISLLANPTANAGQQPAFPVLEREVRLLHTLGSQKRLVDGHLRVSTGAVEWTSAELDRLLCEEPGIGAVEQGARDALLAEDRTLLLLFDDLVRNSRTLTAEEFWEPRRARICAKKQQLALSPDHYNFEKERQRCVDTRLGSLLEKRQAASRAGSLRYADTDLCSNELPVAVMGGLHGALSQQEPRDSRPLDQKRASGEAIDALNSFSSSAVTRMRDEVSCDEAADLRKRRLRETVDLPDLRESRLPPAFRKLPEQLEQRVSLHGFLSAGASQ